MEIDRGRGLEREAVQVSVKASWLSPRFTSHIAGTVNHFRQRKYYSSRHENHFFGEYGMRIHLVK
jgi:hypothetical protein